MSIIIPANSAVGGGFEVANGVRMNRGSSDYFRRTNNTAGTSDKIGTYSGWVKRSTTTLDGLFFEGKDLAANNYTQIYFQATGALTIYGSTGPMDIVTTALFRDPSAWYHVVVAFDTTQGTATNRVKVYVNGVQFTSVTNGNGNAAQYPAENSTIYFAVNGDQQGIGIREDGALLWNGYMSEIVYVDGQALAPTSFGEFDEDSGVWKPINVSGLTFGNNGCYLDFEDSSNLGNVVAGNSTDFTENGLTAVDQTTDTCTNNFATFNSLDSYWQGNTYSEGNIKVLTGTSPYNYNSSTIGVSSGKWYVEVKMTAHSETDGNNYSMIGITSKLTTSATDFLGQNASDWRYYGQNGTIRNNGSDSSYGNSYAVGDIIGIALNLDDNELKFYKNGTVQNSGTAISITAAASTPIGSYFIAVGYYDGADNGTFEINFGSPSFAISSGNADGDGYGNFEYAVPSGFYAICTKNLAEYG